MKIPAFRAGTGALVGSLATVVAATVVGLTLGLELAMLVIATGFLVAIITLLWLSVRNLSGDTPLSLDEALGLGAPTAAEEQKRAILRALKDLEFERGVGKISEEDYREFAARYRAEAKRLITAVDESLGPVQQIAEKLAAERLVRAGLLPSATGEAAPASPQTAEAGAPVADAPVSTAEAATSATSSAARTCPSCQTPNDMDARFCKRCGAPVEMLRGPSSEPLTVKEEAP